MESFIEQNLIPIGEFDYDSVEDGHYVGIVDGTLLVLDYIAYDSVGWAAQINGEFCEVSPTHVSKNLLSVIPKTQEEN